MRYRPRVRSTSEGTENMMRKAMDKHYDENMRGLDFYNPDTDMNPLVTVVGVGGIGSWTALCLAKMGFNRMILIDPDNVEKQNIGCQLYGTEHLGKPKVEALQEIITMQTASNCTLIPEKYEISTPRGIVIACVDNMEVRRKIFVSCQEQGHTVPLFIDCRIGGEVLLLYVINPESAAAQEWYLENWYPDNEASDQPCTGQNIAYVGMFAGAFIAREVGKYCKEPLLNSREIIMDIESLRLEATVGIRAAPPRREEG